VAIADRTTGRGATPLSAIQKFDEALKFTGSLYGPAYSHVVEGLRQTVQGLLQERQVLVERLVAIENVLRNR
jgi:hypothetical protein